MPGWEAGTGGSALALPSRPPIDPDAPYLPVPVEKDSVGHVSRLQAAEPVVHSQNLGRMLVAASMAASGSDPRSVQRGRPQRPK